MIVDFILSLLEINRPNYRNRFNLNWSIFASLDTDISTDCNTLKLTPKAVSLICNVKVYSVLNNSVNFVNKKSDSNICHTYFSVAIDETITD